MSPGFVPRGRDSCGRAERPQSRAASTSRPVHVFVPTRSLFFLYEADLSLISDIIWFCQYVMFYNVFFFTSHKVTSFLEHIYICWVWKSLSNSLTLSLEKLINRMKSLLLLLFVSNIILYYIILYYIILYYIILYYIILYYIILYYIILYYIILYYIIL